MTANGTCVTAVRPEAHAAHEHCMREGVALGSEYSWSDPVKQRRMACPSQLCSASGFLIPQLHYLLGVERIAAATRIAAHLRFERPPPRRAAVYLHEPLCCVWPRASPCAHTDEHTRNIVTQTRARLDFQ